jgi:hypothetical protein
LHVTTDSVHREIIVELSPLTLPAHTSHHTMPQPPPRVMVFPVTGWIEGYSGELVDSSGRAIPGRLLHHLNLIVPQRRELFSTIMQRMGAAGAETPPVALPTVMGHPVLGYPVSRGDTLLIVAMLNNPTAIGYTGARMRVRMPYAAQNTWLRPLSIYPFYLDVTPPAGPHGYDLPAGHSEKSWEGRPAVPARILAVGGHLHKYGVALRFTDVTTGHVLWQTAPSIDAAGEVVGMPTRKFWWRLGVPIHPDHTYRLTAVYDNPTGKAIPDGAMGALGGVVMPDDMDAWPMVDRASAEYQRDVQVTYEGGMSDMHDMDMSDSMQDSTDPPGAAPRVSSGASGASHEGMREGMLTGSLPPRRTAQTP